MERLSVLRLTSIKLIKNFIRKSKSITIKEYFFMIFYDFITIAYLFMLHWAIISTHSRGIISGYINSGARRQFPSFHIRHEKMLTSSLCYGIIFVFCFSANFNFWFPNCATFYAIPLNTNAFLAYLIHSCKFFTWINRMHQVKNRYDIKFNRYFGY